jgi:hypothetical protein
MLAGVVADATVFRYAALLGDKLVLGASDASRGGVIRTEWANPQTGLLEEFDLSSFPITGRPNAPSLASCGFLSPGSWSLFPAGDSSLWLCTLFDSNDVAAVEVFDHVGEGFVYLGQFRATSSCGGAMCSQQAIPGGLIVLGMDVIDPHTQVRTRIPDPPVELLNTDGIGMAFSSSAVMVCAGGQCGLYSFR